MRLARLSALVVRALIAPAAAQTRLRVIALVLGALPLTGCELPIVVLGALVEFAVYEDAAKLEREFREARRLGQYQDALDKAKQALAQRERLSEPAFRRMSAAPYRSPGWDFIADDAASVAELYADLGQDTMAEPYLKRALLIRERQQGLNSRAVAETLEQYGQLLHRLGRDIMGVGFFVSPDGLMLTTLPAIRGAKSIIVTCPINLRVEASRQESAAPTVLSVLHVPVRGASYLTLATEADAVHTGDQVVALDVPPTNPEGVVMTLSGPTGEATLMQMSALVEPGNLGAPVLNARGQVVGIITLSPADTSPGAWMMPTAEALSLITPPAPQAPLPDHGEILALARAATCRIYVP